MTMNPCASSILTLGDRAALDVFVIDGTEDAAIDSLSAALAPFTNARDAGEER
jgi:hypothetical protein